MTQYTPIPLNGTFQITVPVTSSMNMSDVKWCHVPNSQQEDESYKHFYEVAQTVTGLFIYPMVCFPGVLGNALTIFVLSRRNMHTSTNAFLSALAVSDAIKLISDILYFFVILFMTTSTRLGNLSYAYLYPYAHFVFSFSSCVSAWLTVSVAVERYILVCHPTRARAVWSRKRAVLLCTLIYVIMISIAIPSALRYRTVSCIDVDTGISRLDVELTEMWESEVFTTTYTWAQNLLRSIIPLIVLVVLNACIISALRRTNTKRRKNARHRVTVMMIVVILVFLVCITPDAILSTIFGFGYHEAGYLTKGIREITDTLLAVNSAVNFLIYCAFNQVFRKSFAQTCCPNSRQTGWVTELDESTYRRLSEAKSLISSNNNSPPRQDPPSALLNDNSPSSNGVIYITIDGTDSGGDCKKEDGNESSRYCNSLQVKQYSSTLSPPSPNYHSYDHSSADSHQQHRASSNGLKKSKNSIKCNRAKVKGNVTFCDNVDDINKDKVGEKSRDQSSSDKDSSSEIMSSSTDTQIDTPWKKSEISCNSLPSVSPHPQKKLNNNTTDNNVKKGKKQSILKAKEDVSDAEILSKFRNCDGSLISDSSMRFSVDLNDNTNDLANQTELQDKAYKVCVKDSLKNDRKKCALSVSFNDNSSTGEDSNFLSKGDNELVCDRSVARRNSQCELHKKPCSTITVDKIRKPANNELGTEDVGMAGSPQRSYLNGNILTTDL